MYYRAAPQVATDRECVVSDILKFRQKTGPVDLTGLDWTYRSCRPRLIDSNFVQGLTTDYILFIRHHDGITDLLAGQR